MCQVNPFIFDFCWLSTTLPRVLSGWPMRLQGKLMIGSAVTDSNQPTARQRRRCSRKMAYRKPVLTSRNLTVEIGRTVRYLGVLLDSKLTFAPYLRVTSAAVTRAAKAIGRLMSNVGGPTTMKRRLLSTVVSS